MSKENAPKKFKWTVEFEVDPKWVADGFNLTDEKARVMLIDMLQWALFSEISAKVIKAPTPASIRKAQEG